jgi:hypothetical protein
LFAQRNWRTRKTQEIAPLAQLASHLASWAMPNAWLAELGLYDLAQVETGVFPQEI